MNYPSGSLWVFFFPMPKSYLLRPLTISMEWIHQWADDCSETLIVGFGPLD